MYTLYIVLGGLENVPQQHWHRNMHKHTHRQTLPLVMHKHTHTHIHSGHTQTHTVYTVFIYSQCTHTDTVLTCISLIFCHHILICSGKCVRIKLQGIHTYIHTTHVYDMFYAVFHSQCYYETHYVVLQCHTAYFSPLQTHTHSQTQLIFMKRNLFYSCIAMCQAVLHQNIITCTVTQTSSAA